MSEVKWITQEELKKESDKKPMSQAEFEQEYMLNVCTPQCPKCETYNSHCFGQDNGKWLYRCRKCKITFKVDENGQTNTNKKAN